MCAEVMYLLSCVLEVLGTVEWETLSTQRGVFRIKCLNKFTNSYCFPVCSEIFLPSNYIARCDS